MIETNELKSAEGKESDKVYEELANLLNQELSSTEGEITSKVSEHLEKFISENIDALIGTEGTQIIPEFYMRLEKAVKTVEKRGNVYG